MTVLEMLRSLSLSPNVTRTPSLTDTDDSAPSEDLPEPTITEPELMPTTTGKGTLSLMRSSSKTMSRLSLESRPTSRVRTNSRSSTIMMMFQRPLVVALSEPRIVGGIVRYLNWHEFRMLAMTSHSVRSALEAEECMDLVLARFVPNYTLGARPEEQIHVSLDHLEMFMLSQHMSVHLYPTHALSVVDSLMNAMHMASHTTERFQALTAAHSRIVLLLRSRALAAPSAPEIDEPPSPPLPSAPQLVFPAPLFAAAPAAKPPAKKQDKSENRRSSISSLFTLSRGSSRRNKGLPPLPPPTQKTHRSSIYQSLEKRSSTGIHYSNSVYSNSSQQFASTGRRRSSRPARSKSTPPVHPDDDDILKPPRPWYRRHSSLPGTPASSSRGSLTAVSETREANAPLLPTGPHDLLYASVPARAPVLRVFVPTDFMSPESIRACELNLFRAGLWDTMKTGDVVCNLGYVPRTSSVDQFGRINHSDARQTEWLIFTGHALVPYVPPAPPPPDINILSLPGPAYYSHLYTPTPTQLTLPECEPGPAVCGSVYAFSVPRRSTEPTFTLDSSLGYVKSSRGVARVWKPVWIASFRVDPTFRAGSSRKGKQRIPSLAEEWAGEWVLEGMGTREGERALRDAMDDGQVRFWEWVREKSGPGRNWFRLVDAPTLGVTEVVPPVPSIPAQYMHITDAPVTEEPSGSSVEDDTTTAQTTPASTVEKHDS
ncbi:unnamed protein product [Rhizoctonia solani]|uniref:Uncharacterized protein n=1 Tax=Rhizoctonia solani TaxID=456999 RepID=A0A8H3DPN8_9AGAM|nr:unnamed protein product [Rhizoctonia solani]